MVNPTGYTALDFIGFTDKGTYATNVAYVKNDIVHYAGNLWRCLIDDTTGVVPAEGANWTLFIGEPTNLVERIIAPLEQNPATIAYGIGRQIIYDDYLWEVIKAISIGDSLIDYAVDPTNANIKKADPVETQLLAVKAKEGNLTSLTTTAKNDLVSAINEVDSHTDANTTNIGTLANLTTTAKTNLVSAINEVNTKVSKTEDLISNSGDAYSSTKAYAVGDLCIYNNVLYRCITACSAGSWATNQSCFTADTLVNIFDNLVKVHRNYKNVSPNANGDFILSSGDFEGGTILQITNGNFNYQNVSFRANFYKQYDGSYFVHLINLADESAVTVQVTLEIISV